MKEIFTITTMIQMEFPEHYVHLSETPLFLFANKNIISTADFEKYLESLKMQWGAFKKYQSIK